ncbi:hypothetical protein [Rossellomorea sp. LJF3]|uniref:hypothetical protein n=1 Tax=Rossellomorea sp. LJF3 TaxID=3126099 RepID=UPI00300D78AE
MKRIILTVIFVILFGWISYTMLYNGFSGVKNMSIQTYNGSFEDIEPVTNPKIITTVTGILNRANKITHTQYKIAVEPTYKIKLVYKDTKEVLYVHEGFDTNETLISSDSRDHYFKINQNQTDSIVQLLSK